MAKFKIGEIVQLKSGGPKMTVEGYTFREGFTQEYEVRCRWTSGPKKEAGNYPEESLRYPRKGKTREKGLKK